MQYIGAEFCPEGRSKLTGFLSRRNTASHRCNTRHKALPFVRRGLTANAVFHRPFQRKSNPASKKRRHPTRCLRMNQLMLSYGGIIRIRCKGRRSYLPLSLSYKLPVFKNHVYYTAAFSKLQALSFRAPTLFPAPCRNLTVEMAALRCYNVK